MAAPILPLNSDTRTLLLTLQPQLGSPFRLDAGAIHQPGTQHIVKRPSDRRPDNLTLEAVQRQRKKSDRKYEHYRK